MGQIPCLILLLIPFLVSKGATIVVTVVILLRFVQIYMLTAFNPLPIAFIAQEETRQWGINFFKQYASLVFQCASSWRPTPSPRSSSAANETQRNPRKEAIIMALQMPVYRELTTIESKVFMGMSWRQCLAAVILAVVCGGGYIGLWLGGWAWTPTSPCT